MNWRMEKKENQQRQKEEKTRGGESGGRTVLYPLHQVLLLSPSTSTSLDLIPRCYCLDSSHACWFPCFHCCHHHPPLVPLCFCLCSAYFNPSLILVCPPLVSTDLNLIPTLVFLCCVSVQFLWSFQNFYSSYSNPPYCQGHSHPKLLVALGVGSKSSADKIQPTAHKPTGYGQYSGVVPWPLKQ